jgi:hypothetical protein
VLPPAIRRAAARLVSARRATTAERHLRELAEGTRPILAGPWLGEVGFELLYWVPFLRWFAERYGVAPARLIAVARGGSAAAWYAPFADRTYDALSFISSDEFKRRNEDRRGHLGEQKQVASTPLDDDIVEFVRGAEGRDVGVLHPSVMYRLFAPYWWGHQPIAWVRRYTRYIRITPPRVSAALPADYTAVKFYFNDCFLNTPGNRAFVERTVQRLSEHGPVISLSTGVAVDDHSPCEPDIAAMQGIQHLLSPQTNLLIQSGIVGGARRFVGTYGGFAYLAPLCGVPAVSYYTEPGTFSMRHLDLVRDVLRSEGRPDLLHVIDARTEIGA